MCNTCGCKGAETFESFSIDRDDEGKLHIENKCDGCGKQFSLTTNPNLIGYERAGAIVYEDVDGDYFYFPTYNSYDDLLCKSCHEAYVEDERYGAENFEAKPYGDYHKRDFFTVAHGKTEEPRFAEVHETFETWDEAYKEANRLSRFTDGEYVFIFPPRDSIEPLIPPYVIEPQNKDYFGAYDDSISERQEWLIGELGGNVDKSMNRSKASDYIKELQGKESGTWKGAENVDLSGGLERDVLSAMDALAILRNRLMTLEGKDIDEIRRNEWKDETYEGKIKVGGLYASLNMTPENIHVIITSLQEQYLGHSAEGESKRKDSHAPNMKLINYKDVLREKMKNQNMKDAETFRAESKFDELSNEIAEQYEKKGKSKEEAEKIGKATAYKVGVAKYGKRGMTNKAKAGMRKKKMRAENFEAEEYVIEYTTFGGRMKPKKGTKEELKDWLKEIMINDYKDKMGIVDYEDEEGQERFEKMWDGLTLEEICDNSKYFTLAGSVSNYFGAESFEANEEAVEQTDANMVNEGSVEAFYGGGAKVSVSSAGIQPTANPSVDEAFDVGNQVGLDVAEQEIMNENPSVEVNYGSEDMSLRESAKLGFGVGAGLLGFNVALLGIATIGGFLLNRD